MDVEELARRQDRVRDFGRSYREHIESGRLPRGVMSAAGILRVGVTERDPTRDPEFPVNVHRRGDAWVVIEPFDEHAGRIAYAGSSDIPRLDLALDVAWASATRAFIQAWCVPGSEHPDLADARVVGSADPGDDPVLRPWRLARTARDRRASSWGLAQVARHPNTPPRTLARLAASGPDAARWFAAAHPRVPARVLAGLYATAAPGPMRWFLAHRPDAPAELVAEWAREDSALWRAVAAHPSTASEELDRLEVVSYRTMDRRLAEHPHASPELVERIARRVG